MNRSVHDILRYLIIILLFFWKSSAILCQKFDQLKVNTTSPDTTTTEGIKPKKKNGFGTLFRGTPGKVALYGLIVPSAGQVYNRKWWKVPLALGIDGFTVYNYVQASQNFKTYNTIFYNLVDGGTDPNFSSPADVKPIRDSFRKQKEFGVVYLILGHLLTVFDAFIDRHLIEFDISDDLSPVYFPSSDASGVPSFGIAMRF